jgi:hypothetical protein
MAQHGQTFEEQITAANNAARADALSQDLAFATLQGVDIHVDTGASNGF